VLPALHIRKLLGFIGMSDAAFVRAGKLALGPEAGRRRSGPHTCNHSSELSRSVGTRLNTFAAFTTIYRGLRDLTMLRYKGGVVKGGVPVRRLSWGERTHGL
jgi:hypothetical protein